MSFFEGLIWCHFLSTLIWRDLIWSVHGIVPCLIEDYLLWITLSYEQCRHAQCIQTFAIFNCYPLIDSAVSVTVCSRGLSSKLPFISSSFEPRHVEHLHPFPFLQDLTVLLGETGSGKSWATCRQTSSSQFHWRFLTLSCTPRWLSTLWQERSSRWAMFALSCRSPKSMTTWVLRCPTSSR